MLEVVYFVVQLLCRPCVTRASLSHQFAGTSSNSVHAVLEKSPVKLWVQMVHDSRGDAELLIKALLSTAGIAQGKKKAAQS